jgi:predicted amidohydrolase YtcJ
LYTFSVTTRIFVTFASLLSALCVPLSPCASAQKCTTYDTLYYNGNILTGKDLFTTYPERVHSIAIQNGLIVAIDQADALKSCAKQSIDLHGAFVMPGFNDAHTHIASAGQQKLSVDLDNVPSLAAMQATIKAYAATLAPGQWILGGGWDHTKWPSKTLPTRQDLDAVTGDHPAFLERTDGHIAIANSAALHAANITQQTPSPNGGKIDHDGNGELTGIIREAPALALVQAHIPPPTFQTRRKALQLSIDDALSHGVTSIQDFSDWDDWLVLEELEHTGKLPLRVSEWIAFDLPLPVLDERRASHDPNDPLLHLGFLKAFMDGSLGSRTAALNDPYTDDATNSGIPRYDQQKLNAMATERAADGFQLGFHAIGDLANDMALDAFAAAEQVGRPANQPAPPRNPGASIVTTSAHTPEPRDFRFRMEHAQVVSPGTFHRFHDLGVIASMQPVHLLTDMEWAGQRLGPDRSKRAYAWKSFLDHGVTLAFGTDYPVEAINPFRGLYAAVTRQNESGTKTFEPQEKITLNQAIYAYTQGSAFAEFRETQKGLLAIGFDGDFVVLSADITKSAPQQLLHTKVLRTVVGGKTVYLAP